MSKTALPLHSTTARPSKQDDLEKLNNAMEEMFGDISGDYTDLIDNPLHCLIEQHPDWYVKRYQSHRWEVRTGVKDKTYYGATLSEALCRALLEIP